MDSKHTPGPWKVETTTGINGVYPILITGNMRFVADFPRLVPEAIPQQMADAHLISAAPDLLDALRKCYEYLDMIPESAAGGDDDAIKFARTARAAIAKAEGR